jgi:hypothetical protein
VHILSPPFGFFWFLERPFVVVTQSTVTRADVQGAEAFLTLMDQVVDHSRARFAKGEQMFGAWVWP